MGYKYLASKETLARLVLEKSALISSIATFGLEQWLLVGHDPIGG